MNGMTYERINAMASLAVSGLTKRLLDALNDDDLQKLSVFTAELVFTLWKMHRTERGLPTSVSYVEGFNAKQYEDKSRRTLEELGYGELAEAVNKLTSEATTKLMRELGIEFKTPLLLEK